MVKQGDFCNAPFEAESFDKVYAIEASCHAADLSKVYREAFRVLKPGGLFASYEWIMTDKYDPTDPYHRRLKEEIMVGVCLFVSLFVNGLFNRLLHCRLFESLVVSLVRSFVCL